MIIYTESLFLFLSIFCLYKAYKAEWFWACLAGMLAALTRNIGIFLIIPVFWKYMEGREWNIRKIGVEILYMSLIPLGTGLYFFYIWRHVGNFWYYFDCAKAWAGRNTDFFVLPTVKKYLTEILPREYGNWGIFSANLWNHVVDIGVFFCALLLLVMMVKRIKETFLLPYTFVVFYVLVSSGGFLSLPRYLMVLFPFFILLAELSSKHPGWEYMIRVTFPMMAGGLAVAFINYYWVA